MTTNPINQQCFVDLVINEIILQSLVDTGASHNFLKTKVAKELGLRFSPCGVVVKVVKSKAKASIGVASLVYI
jgi:predicted aspartyl protease